MSVDTLIKLVGQFTWDYNGDPVELSAAHVAEVLNRYINGQLSALDVENWANLIEGREDIEFAAPDQDRLKSVMHELANPLLTEPLYIDGAKKLLEKLYARNM